MAKAKVMYFIFIVWRKCSPNSCRFQRKSERRAVPRCSVGTSAWIAADVRACCPAWARAAENSGRGLPHTKVKARGEQRNADRQVFGVGQPSGTLPGTRCTVRQHPVRRPTASPHSALVRISARLLRKEE